MVQPGHLERSKIIGISGKGFCPGTLLVFLRHVYGIRSTYFLRGLKYGMRLWDILLKVCEFSTRIFKCSIFMSLVSKKVNIVIFWITWMILYNWWLHRDVSAYFVFLSAFALASTEAGVRNSNCLHGSSSDVGCIWLQ